MATKLIFLHDNLGSPKIPGILGSIIEFDEKCVGKSPAEIFAIYDVISLDIGVYKNWYAENKKTISDNPAFKCIFLHPVHVKIEDELKEMLTNLYKVDAIIKEFPKEFRDKADVVAKILNGHLPKLDLPNGASCFMTLLSIIKSLFR